VCFDGNGLNQPPKSKRGERLSLPESRTKSVRSEENFR
jgi:hypothetical protein